MLGRITNFFTPPQLEGDEENARRVRLLNMIVMSSLLGAALYLPFATPERSPYALLSVGVIFVVRLVMRRGHIRFASVAMVTGLVFVFAMVIFTGGGVRAPAYSGLIVLILFAGLLLGWKAAAGMTIFSILYGLMLLRVDALELLPDPVEYPEIAYWVIEGIFFLMAGFMLTLSLQLADDAQRRADHELAHRNQVEEALRESESRLRKIIDNEPECVKILDLDGRLLDMNRAGLAMIEADGLQEVAGLSVADLVCEEHRTAFRTLTSAVSRGETGTLVFEIEGLKGTHRWLETHAVPMNDDHGTITALLGITRDITERKKAEAALKKNETLLRHVLNTSPAIIFVKDRDSTILVANSAMASFYNLTVEQVIGRRQSDLHRDFGARRGDVEKWLADDRNVIDTGEINHFLESGTDSNNRLRWFDTVKYPIDIGSGRRGVLVFSEDITERQRAEDALQKRYRELSAIYEASKRLQRLLSPNRLAGEIIEVLEGTLEYTFGAVLLLDEKTGELDPFALSEQDRGEEFTAADREYIRSRGVGVGVGITGWVARHGESLRLDDVRQDARYLPMRADIRSELCVPMLIQDRVIGVVNIESTRVAEYSDDDQRLLETIAAQIAIAVQNARLINELQQGRDRLAELSRRFVQANESERRLISRELHDRVGQNLTALSINLQNMKGLLSPRSAQAIADKFDDAQELVQDTTRFIREVMAELHPPELEDYGLAAALETLMEKAASRGNLELTARLPSLNPPLPPDVSIALFRVAQEASNNILKHAQARGIGIELEEREGRIQLRIEDDGRGFELAGLSRSESPSWGFRIMRERIESIGGTMKIESAASKGTRLTFEFARS